MVDHTPNGVTSPYDFRFIVLTSGTHAIASSAILNLSIVTAPGRCLVNMDKSQCIHSSNWFFNHNLNSEGHTHLEKYLQTRLISLHKISQNPRYHPEGDALYHSLQVFQLAYHSSADPQLWAAALLHDIGKAYTAGVNHAQVGAEALDGLLSSRIVWLIRHHLHLLRMPRRTRRWLRNTPQLQELELLFRWDRQGRSSIAQVLTPQTAIHLLMQQVSYLLAEPLTLPYYEDKRWF